MKHIRKILSPQQTTELSPFQVRWLRSLGYLPAIAGGDGEGEGEGQGQGQGEGGGSGEGQGEGGSEGEEDEDEGGESSEGGEGGEEGRRRERTELRDDETVVSKSEFERLKRIAKEEETKRKKAEREARQNREREAREAGNWEELVRERDERIAEIEAEREAARLELDATLRNQRITAAATRLHFRDPGDAGHFLSEDETMDDASTERALKRLSREKPYLVDPRKSTAAPANGEGATLTIEEIKRMKPDEVNARWTEVQAALAAQGGARN